MSDRCYYNRNHKLKFYKRGYKGSYIFRCQGCRRYFEHPLWERL